MPTQTLIFANGDSNDGPMVRQALDSGANALILAADGGARMARHYGLSPHVILGDMDSLSAEELAEFPGVEIKRYPEEKDETDLEIALKYAAAQGATWIRIIGGIGDRLDQTLSNAYLLGLPELKGCDARIVAGKQETRLLLPGDWLLDGADGDTVSLIPLSGAARGIRTENLYYPLRDEDLFFGPARGVSNVLRGQQARVSFREGVLLVVHTIGRA